MTFTTWIDVLNQSFQNITYGLLQYIPNLIIAILIFIIGWLVGIGIGRVVAQIIDTLPFDKALRVAGVEQILERAGFKLSSGAFVGLLVKWFFIIVFLVASLNVLNLTQVNIFMREVVLSYLPHVIVAVLILLVAAVLAETAYRIVAGSAKAARLVSANFLGTAARWSIWIFAILAALNQLQVAPGFVQILFTGIVIAISLALGLAFGLGGQQVAARYLEHIREQIK